MSENKINSDERFVRWQQVLREHLTFLNNLILTLTIGIFGFLLSIVKDKDFVMTSCQKIFFTSGFILIFTSIISGLATSFSRLHDFRTTLNKIKNERAGNSSELNELKEMMSLYRIITWGLFYAQIIIFCIGTLCLTISFLMIYKTKLF